MPLDPQALQELVDNRDHRELRETLDPLALMDPLVTKDNQGPQVLPDSLAALVSRGHWVQ